MVIDFNPMRVFLSYALSPFDGALSARLRAVALAYNIDLLLPIVLDRNTLPAANKKKIKDSDAVLILISHFNPTNNPHYSIFQPMSYQAEIEAVQLELKEAARLKRPFIALVENASLIQGIPHDRIIVFNRDNPSSHEHRLFQELKRIETKKNSDELIKALGALGLIALGFLALSEFTKESNGEE